MKGNIAVTKLIHYYFDGKSPCLKILIIFNINDLALESKDVIL